MGKGVKLKNIKKKPHPEGPLGDIYIWTWHVGKMPSGDLKSSFFVIVFVCVCVCVWSPHLFYVCDIGTSLSSHHLYCQIGQYGWCGINEAWVLPKKGMSWGGKVFVAEVSYLGNNNLSMLSTAEDNWTCVLTGRFSSLFASPKPVTLNPKP